MTAMGRGVAIVAASAAALLSAAGCGGEPRTEPLDVDKEHPLAIFRGDDLGLVDYAQLKLSNQCLAEAGYRQNLDTMVSRPQNPFDNLIITPRTFGPATEQEARRLGFGMDRMAAPASIVSFDPSYDRAQEACSKKAWQRLGDTAYTVYRGYFELGNKLSAPLRRTIDERLDPQLSVKMLGCLKGKGHRVSDEAAFRTAADPRLLGVELRPPLPAEAEGWQPRRQPGTVQVGPAVPAQQYRASPREGAIAVAWLQCRRETGFADHQLAVAVQVQRELVAQHETAFVELNPQIERVARDAAALVGTR